MAMVAVFESLPSTINCTGASRPASMPLGEVARNHQRHQRLGRVSIARSICR